MASRTALITSVLLLLLLVAPSSSLVTFNLHGNVHPVGFLYVTMVIGEPAREYNLDVDTGSTLTWVQCNVPNCRGDCKKWQQHHPYYQLTSAAKVVSRNDPLCQVLHPVLGQQQCHYRIDYHDSHSKGLLIRDKFTLPSRHGQHTFAMGCGYDQSWGAQYHPPPVDGILGLGRKGSSVSLISQLMKEHVITKDVISHCISKEGGGFLHIGDYQHTSSAITWIDINPNAGRGHYSPKFPARLHFGSSGGPVIGKDISVVFDSGSTFTYFTPQTYHLIENKVTATLDKSFRKAREDEDKTMDLCWVGPKKYESIDEVKPFFKSIFLVFSKNTVLEIPPDNYLIISHGHKNVCFGILPLRGNTNIIGAITMQDRVVVYDNEHPKIGWAHDLCKSVSGPVITSRL